MKKYCFPSSYSQRNAVSTNSTHPVIHAARLTVALLDVPFIFFSHNAVQPPAAAACFAISIAALHNKSSESSMTLHMGIGGPVGTGRAVSSHSSSNSSGGSIGSYPGGQDRDRHPHRTKSPWVGGLTVARLFAPNLHNSCLAVLKTEIGKDRPTRRSKLNLLREVMLAFADAIEGDQLRTLRQITCRTLLTLATFGLWIGMRFRLQIRQWGTGNRLPVIVRTRTKG